MSELVSRRLATDMCAFLRAILSSCAGCFRKSECDRCDLRMAGSLFARICSASVVEEEERAEIGMADRFASVMRQMRAAGRPLSAKEIDLAEHCNKRTKWLTLRKMADNGLIVKVDGMYMANERYEDEKQKR